MEFSNAGLAIGKDACGNGWTLLLLLCMISKVILVGPRVETFHLSTFVCKKSLKSCDPCITRFDCSWDVFVFSSCKRNQGLLSGTGKE